jgi:hypothetical protein
MQNPTPPPPNRSARQLSHLHSTIIADSSISDDVRDERGYFTATAAADLLDWGWDYPALLTARFPALVIPVRGALEGGAVSYAVIRPDTPRCDRDGRFVKYETPRGARNVVDVPPRVFGLLGSPSTALWIVEGARKADSLVSAGAHAVSISGVFGWRGQNGQGGSVALPDWEAVALRGRDLRIGFDSDVRVNPNVARAAARLGAFLGARGAHVRYLVLGDDS